MEKEHFIQITRMFSNFQRERLVYISSQKTTHSAYPTLRWSTKASVKLVAAAIASRRRLSVQDISNVKKELAMKITLEKRVPLAVVLVCSITTVQR